MKTTPMKALHTRAATTMSLLSEVATPLDGFILTAKLKWIGGGGLQNIQIHIFYPFRLIK